MSFLPPLRPSTHSTPFRKGLPMTLSLLLRSALLHGGEAIAPALGTAERQLLASPHDALALACKAVLLIQLACHGRTGNRDSYVPTAIGLMDEALQAGDPRDAVLHWTVGMGLASLPLGWNQADRATDILRASLDDPALMRWQRLFGLTVLSGLHQDREQTSDARTCYARAQSIDPEVTPELFAQFLTRRNECGAQP
jgi:hypothetical protein